MASEKIEGGSKLKTTMKSHTYGEVESQEEWETGVSRGLLFARNGEKPRAATNKQIKTGKIFDAGYCYTNCYKLLLTASCQHRTTRISSGDRGAELIVAFPNDSIALKLPLDKSKICITIQTNGDEAALISEKPRNCTKDRNKLSPFGVMKLESGQVEKQDQIEGRGHNRAFQFEREHMALAPVLAAIRPRERSRNAGRDATVQDTIRALHGGLKQRATGSSIVAIFLGTWVTLIDKVEIKVHNNGDDDEGPDDEVGDQGRVRAKVGGEPLYYLGAAGETEAEKNTVQKKKRSKKSGVNRRNFDGSTVVALLLTDTFVPIHKGVRESSHEIFNRSVRPPTGTIVA
ncbi:hypothetical protein M408DRAFT_312164 [Serendipita vermifera MAFF 305830]|uniref:Uncharacterized protein n=1 Tax=Serendipita vermifera MAFF 305830 TaxID=933852 RepID=A0A0C2XCC8_SERVB|nr:hypothetical protein M408DRAFT_312164 [Serendipita vermifera MAFF 305830]